MTIVYSHVEAVYEPPKRQLYTSIKFVDLRSRQRQQTNITSFKKESTVSLWGKNAGDHRRHGIHC
jgi:hypothetical protein